MFNATRETDTSFTDLGGVQTPSFEEVDNAGYGKTRGPLDLGEVKVHQLPINQIEPDPRQPRRTIPASVRLAWDGDMGTLFETWEAVINAYEQRTPFNIATLLRDTPTDEDTPDEEHEAAYAPEERALRRIIHLAVSIGERGLINPITVVPKPSGGFLLETGERRWLAHHLLLQYTDDPRWKKIPARKFDGLDVWRQASENNARDNLNAIGKARQLAILIMDILERDGHTVHPFEQFGDEQAFYAQVAEARTPHGSSELLLSAMGVEHRNAIMRYKNLLTLPSPVWHMADEHDWPERRLRDLVGLPEAESIRRAYDMVDLSPVGDKDETPHEMSPMGSKTRLPRFEKFLHRDLPKLARDLQRLKGDERAEAIIELRRLLENLEAS